MHGLRVAVVGVWVVWLAACTPSLNWREVRPEETPLVVLLPCKPDKGAKTLPIGGQPTELRMLGCEADGMLFTVANAQLAEGADVAATLTQWKTAMLANAGATSSQDAPFRPAGATPYATAALSRFQGGAGHAPVGAAVAVFARGHQVFQAAVFGKTLDAAATDAFFASVRVD